MSSLAQPRGCRSNRGLPRRSRALSECSYLASPRKAGHLVARGKIQDFAKCSVILKWGTPKRPEKNRGAVRRPALSGERRGRPPLLAGRTSGRMGKECRVLGTGAEPSPAPPVAPDLTRARPSSAGLPRCAAAGLAGMWKMGGDSRAFRAHSECARGWGDLPASSRDLVCLHVLAADTLEARLFPAAVRVCDVV